MPPWASILRSRWRPGSPSENPRAYFGGLGGDVGAPGGLLEAPRRSLWISRGGLGTPRERFRDHFGIILGRLLERCWSMFFPVRWYLESSWICAATKLVFSVFPKTIIFLRVFLHKKAQKMFSGKMHKMFFSAKK